MNPKLHFPALQNNEVHIWAAYLEYKRDYINYFTAVLSKEEIARANSYKFPYHQRRFIAARGILRYLLSIYLQGSPHSINIQYGKWGKPYIETHFNLQFNLSHSKDYAIYAFTPIYEVGIDIEYINGEIHIEDLVKFVFSNSEIDCWEKQSLDTKINSFFTRWVMKEAFLKALGKGWLENKLSVKFYTKNFDPTSLQASNNIINPYCFNLMQEYACALYVNGRALRPMHFTWHPEMLYVPSFYENKRVLN